MLVLNAPVAVLPRLNAHFAARLRRLGIETIKDLVYHAPVRYEDLSRIYPIADLAPNQDATVRGVLGPVRARRAWHRRMTITETVVEDETGAVKVVWFNQAYIRNQLKPGMLVNVSGKITQNQKGELQFSNPAIERADREAPTRHTGRIVGIYPETKGLTSKGLRYLVEQALDRLKAVVEYLPSEILERENLMVIDRAIRLIHFPPDIESAEQAKTRLTFDDLFFLQLAALKQKLELSAERAPAIPHDPDATKNLLAALPFELTLSQKKALFEITQDLSKPHPMNRLLQGDVGSGKTIIAALAGRLVSSCGFQTAFMAPTEILARQHYATITKTFPDFEDGIALLTGAEARIRYGRNLETTMKKSDAIKQVGAGAVRIVIGTHALIQKGVLLPRLALVIVDEQHRFGVRERAALIKSSPSSSSSVPHFLSMSATPIPRTLSLTLFGDLDLSLITELPKDRKPIITKIVAPENRAKAYEFIREQIQRGRQAFVVCPRIERGETGENSRYSREELLQAEVKTVKEEFEKLSKKIFPDLHVAMLHGKLKVGEKSAVMSAFRDNKAHILVATSVVEVGVDVPNATIMMIESAERFGLAQLYQFRGRVGRGSHQSFCFLFTEAKTKSTGERLQSIATAKNGLELAERDLKLRGPGEFIGRAQTGMPDIAMKAIRHPSLVKSARAAAEELLRTDRNLTRFPLLRARLDAFQTRIHWE